MELKFYLKLERDLEGCLKTNAKGMVSLQAVIHQHGKRKKIGVGETILPHLWNDESERVEKNHPDAARINGQINKVTVWAGEAEEKVRVVNGYATADDIAAYIKSKLKPWKGVEAHTPAKKELPRDPAGLLEHWKEVNKGYLATESMRKYNQVVAQLETFSSRVTIDAIDEAFMRRYSTYLAKQQLASGTVQKHYQFIKEMRSLVGLSVKERWLTHKTSYSQQPDLTSEELLKLINARLTKPAWQKERDLWVLQMFLGIRPGDFEKVKSYHRKTVHLHGYGEVQVVELSQGKTHNLVQIPLPPLAIRIWDKYEGHFILPTQQVRGRYIKVIAELVGLNRMFVKRKMVGGKVREEIQPICDLIKPYTARHTAASLVYEGSGGDDSLAGWLLGHAQHGIKGTTGIYVKDKAARVLPLILSAWEKILEGKENWPGFFNREFQAVIYKIWV